MILKGNARAGGADLARHLMNARDNDSVELAETRGFVADDLKGSFAEAEAIATGTRCEEYLYSLSINPTDPLSRAQYDHAIAKVEKKLGLTDQPRAVVFHVKEGREHCHVVWSRIDAEQMKAVHMDFDRQKLRAASKELARDFGHDLPLGLQADRGADRFKDRYNDVSYAEIGQSERSGLSPFDRKEAVTKAYQQSDSVASMQAALAEHGFMLAFGDKTNRKGQRTPVIVDRGGEVTGLARNLNGVRADDIRTNLKLDQAHLPTVQQAKDLLAEQLRQKASEKPRDGFDAVQRVKDAEDQLKALTVAQRAEAKALKGDYRDQLKGIRDGEAIALQLTEKRIKQAYRPEWAQLYRTHEAELAAVQAQIASPMKRIKALLQGKAGDAFDFENRNTLAGAFRFVIKGPADLAKLEKRHLRERRELGDRMRLALREERREIKAETALNRREAKADYDRERMAFKRDHAWQRDKAQKALTVAERARDKAQIVHERPVFNTAPEQAKAPIKQALKRASDRRETTPKPDLARPTARMDVKAPERLHLQPAVSVPKDRDKTAKAMQEAAQKRRAEDKAVMKAAKDAAKQAGVDRRDSAPTQDAKATASRDHKPREERNETRAERRERIREETLRMQAQEKAKGLDLGRTR